MRETTSSKPSPLPTSANYDSDHQNHKYQGALLLHHQHLHSVQHDCRGLLVLLLDRSQLSQSFKSLLSSVVDIYLYSGVQTLCCCCCCCSSCPCQSFKSSEKQEVWWYFLEYCENISWRVCCWNGHWTCTISQTILFDILCEGACESVPGCNNPVGNVHYDGQHTSRRDLRTKIDCITKNDYKTKIDCKTKPNATKTSTKVGVELKKH